MCNHIPSDMSSREFITLEIFKTIAPNEINKTAALFTAINLADMLIKESRKNSIEYTDYLQKHPRG